MYVEESRDGSILRRKISFQSDPFDRVTAWLRGMTRFGNLIVEGRDITTAVFPDSPARFYLVASAEARAIYRQLAADFPSIPVYRVDLAGSYDNLAHVLHRQGRLGDAEQAYRQALEFRKQLATDFPNVPAYRQGLIHSHNNLSSLLVLVGRRRRHRMERGCLGINVVYFRSRSFFRLSSLKLGTTHNLPDSGFRVVHIAGYDGFFWADVYACRI